MQDDKPAPLLDKQAIFILVGLVVLWFGYQTFYVAPRLRARQEAARREAEALAQAQAQGQGENPPADLAPVDSTEPVAVASPAPEQSPAPEPEPEQTFALDTPEHQVVLSSLGGSLRDLTFKNLKGSTYALVQSREQDMRERPPYEPLRPFHAGLHGLTVRVPGTEPARTEEVSWRHEDLPGGGHRFRLALPDGLVLRKDYLPPEAPAEGEAVRPYHFDLVLAVENPAAEARELPGLTLTGPAGMEVPSLGRSDTGLEVLLASRDERGRITLENNPAATLQDPKVPPVQLKPPEGGQVAYFGLATHYFAALVIPWEETGPKLVGASGEGLFASLGLPAPPEHSEHASQALVRGALGPLQVPARGQVSQRFRIYVGPRTKALLDDDDSPYAGHGLEEVTNFGWFDGFASLLLSFLGGLHALVQNWGVAVIVLTFLVRGLLLPLSVWSQKNMLRMQKIGPELQSLKEKFSRKDGSMTPEQQRQFSAAQMELMRKHGVNPVGCLGPMFLQIPVFFGLWKCLNYAFELRQTPFVTGWINDLSVPDVVARLPFVLPLLGTNAVSILPLIMVGTYLLQQQVQPVPSDPRAAEQQRMMKFIFPVFGLLLYTMPSGLMLYFITSSLWSIGEMRTVRRWIEQGEAGRAAPQPARA